MKQCTKCNEIKPLTEFYNKRNQCIPCVKTYVKHHTEKNKEKVREYREKYYSDNKEKHQEKNKQWYSKNRDVVLNKQKEYYQNNKESIKEYKEKWYESNKPKIREYKKEYTKKRIKEDSVYKFKLNVRSLLYNGFRRNGYTKRSKSNEIIGCDWNTLKEHIEKQFDDNMSWDNYGSYWDIDHIIPLSLAKTEEDIIKLNHYTNLQPLEKYYNRCIKNDKEYDLLRSYIVLRGIDDSID
jgi:hypothetical protein